MLFTAAGSKEVARYSSDRLHLFPFNLPSTAGRHSIRDGDRSAGLTYELGMRLRLMSPYGSKNLLPLRRFSLLTQRR